MRKSGSIKIFSLTVIASLMLSLLIANTECYSNSTGNEIAGNICCEEVSSCNIEGSLSLKSQNCCELSQQMQSARAHIVNIAQKIKQHNLPSAKSNTVILNIVQDHELLKTNLFSFSGGEHLTVLRI